MLNLHVYLLSGKATHSTVAHLVFSKHTWTTSPTQALQAVNLICVLTNVYLGVYLYTNDTKRIY